MRQQIESSHWSDKDRNPAGGSTCGKGFAISWQNGPLGRGGDRLEPNGAFVEGIIAAAIDRLEYYQSSKFNCSYNAEAIDLLTEALERLDARTQDRESRNIEGTRSI